MPTSPPLTVCTKFGAAVGVADLYLHTSNCSAIDFVWVKNRHFSLTTGAILKGSKGGHAALPPVIGLLPTAPNEIFVKCNRN